MPDHPPHTKRLTIYLDERIMAQAEDFISKSKESGTPMTKQKLFETAFREYMNRAGESEFDTYLTMAESLRRKQKEIQEVLIGLGEAQLLLVYELIEKHGFSERFVPDFLSSSADRNIQELIEGLALRLSRGESYYRELLSEYNKIYPSDTDATDVSDSVRGSRL